mmetsp:Transcript_755/g.1506  ORF Transcript_755/g.1506 Transcript_755/m.1506 type:complete len:326 (+) Transcript_755:809-1786(+)
MDLELGCLAGNGRKELHERADNVVDGDVQVVRPNLFCELLGSITCLSRRVLRAHVGGVEDLIGKLFARFRHKLGVAHNAPHVSQYGLVLFLDGFDHQLAHGTHESRSGRRIGATRQRKEVPASPTTSQIVPHPARWPVGDLFLRLEDRGRDRAAWGFVAPGHAELHFDNRHRRNSGGLTSSACGGGAVRANVRQVYDADDNLNVVHRELLSLRDNLSVRADHRAPVVVQTIAIAALLIGVEVAPSTLGGGAVDEVETLVQLAKLVVRPTPVGDDLGSVQAQKDVWAVRREQLLACLAGDGAVVEIENHHAKGHGSLTCDLGNGRR